jgi:hypothetical protein
MMASHVIQQDLLPLSPTYAKATKHPSLHGPKQLEFYVFANETFDQHSRCTKIAWETSQHSMLNYHVYYLNTPNCHFDTTSIHIIHTHQRMYPSTIWEPWEMLQLIKERKIESHHSFRLRFMLPAGHHTQSLEWWEKQR